VRSKPQKRGSLRLSKAGNAQIMNLMDNFIDIYWDEDFMAGRPLQAWVGRGPQDFAKIMASMDPDPPTP
jgi:hypothetical protein